MYTDAPIPQPEGRESEGQRVSPGGEAAGNHGRSADTSAQRPERGLTEARGDVIERQANDRAARCLLGLPKLTVDRRLRLHIPEPEAGQHTRRANTRPPRGKSLAWRRALR